VPTENLVVYGSDWCGDCRRTKRFLNQHNIRYTFIDVALDPQASEFVVKVNHGMRSIPTLVFGDGSMLVEPSNAALAEKLGLTEYA
jgi:glutaredoxin-like protein